MLSPRVRKIVGIVLAVATAQGLAILVYLKVEESRGAPEDSAFRYERLASGAGPDLTLIALDGSRRNLSQLRGKAVLLHFWATWCLPCRKELPGLLALGRQLAKDEQLHVVAVSLDTDWAKVRDFFGGEVPPEIVRDGLGLAMHAYGLSTLPDTYLLAADGSLLARFSGARDWQTTRARNVLLAESGRQRE